MKAGDIVIAPEGCAAYLTAGKEYSVVYMRDLGNGYRYEFDVIDDEGDKISCRQLQCSHLYLKDWILKSSYSYSRDEILKITDNMKRFGGGFIKALSEAIAKADEENLEKLRNSFGDEFEKYLKFE